MSASVTPPRSPASPAEMEPARGPDAAVPHTGGAPAFDSVEDSPQFRDRVRLVNLLFAHWTVISIMHGGSLAPMAGRCMEFTLRSF